MVIPVQAAASTGGTDRRALLIEAATALFTERSYDEITTVEIAKRAGVAYGLIAHYFTNKRGLYLATVAALAGRLQAVHDAPAAGDTLPAQVRNLLARHVAYIEDNAPGFRALLRGGVGSDPEVRAIIEGFRWQGATRMLELFGVSEPIAPALRTAMQGWVTYVDDSITDHLRHHELSRQDIVELAVGTLAAALRAACAIDPDLGIKPGLIDQLST